MIALSLMISTGFAIFSVRGCCTISVVVERVRMKPNDCSHLSNMYYPICTGAGTGLGV